MNTTYMDYCIKLGMERMGDPTFNNGNINKMPFPNISIDLKEYFRHVSMEQVKRVRNRSVCDVKSSSFMNNLFFKVSSISDGIDLYKTILENSKRNYLKELDDSNQRTYKYFNFTDKERSAIENILNYKINKEGEIFNIDNQEVVQYLVDALFGVLFSKWDIRILKYLNINWLRSDIFLDRKHSPFLYGPRASTLDLVLPEYHDKIEEIWDMPYPIKTLEECATVSDINPITDKLKEVIKYFWPDSHDTIVEELLEHFKVNDLDEIFDKHSKFFDAHLKDYTRNKRVSPIYWHLGVPSGKFNIWIYYPKLNENSLLKIVNELVEQKLEDVRKQVAALEMSSASKELHDQMALRDELKDFKEELLRVAQLPYKPNQDDGVLITAAPLHNLFRHTKWRKASEACWKKLEKGEYDWAHLSYSIWPDRVANKCKKDLSMAIAHGLESICEIKPKEKKTRKKPEIKVEIQDKLL